MIWFYGMNGIHQLYNSYFGRIKISVFGDKNKFNSGLTGKIRQEGA